MAATCLALWAGAATAASAQQAGAAPPLEVLVKCADMGDRDARLACYDAAMRASGYAPKPEAVAEADRKKFGLGLPHIGGGKHAENKKAKKEAAPAPEGNPSEITLEVAQVAVVQPVGRLVIFSTDGQIWEQTDSDTIGDPPQAGFQMTIHKGVIGGYLCDVTKFKTVHCKRDR
jgi:hypothetical protein